MWTKLVTVLRTPLTPIEKLILTVFAAGAIAGLASLAIGGCNTCGRALAGGFQGAGEDIRSTYHHVRQQVRHADDDGRAEQAALDSTESE